MTSAISTDQKSKTSTSSRADSRANRSVLPGSVEANRMTVISGLTCFGLFKRQGPVGLLERMLLGSSIWALDQVLADLENENYAIQTFIIPACAIVRRIGETESGLSDMMIPTPVASELTGAEYTKTINYRDGVFYRQSKRKGVRHGARLGQYCRVFTKFCRRPKAQDSRAGLTDRGKSNFGEVVQGTTGLRLQPLFVEWMMGFPPGWTDVELTAKQHRVERIKALGECHRAAGSEGVGLLAIRGLRSWEMKLKFD